jgi:hypothetical protein
MKRWIGVVCAFLLGVATIAGAATYSPVFYPKFKAFQVGTTIPLSGGKVYTYLPGTTTPVTTYQDSAGVTPNTNPIILDSNGEGVIFYDGYLKLVLYDSSDVLVWTTETVSGGGGVSSYDALNSRPTINGVTVTGSVLDNASNYPQLNQNTSGNATTATRLGANGANCATGYSARGVDEYGAAEGCFIPTEGGGTYEPDNVAITGGYLSGVQVTVGASDDREYLTVYGAIQIPTDNSPWFIGSTGAAGTLGERLWFRSVNDGADTDDDVPLILFHVNNRSGAGSGDPVEADQLVLAVGANSDMGNEYLETLLALYGNGRLAVPFLTLDNVTIDSWSDIAGAGTGTTTSILKGNGSGGFDNAVAGTDYVAPESLDAKQDASADLADLSDGVAATAKGFADDVPLKFGTDNDFGGWFDSATDKFVLGLDNGDILFTFSKAGVFYAPTIQAAQFESTCDPNQGECVENTFNSQAPSAPVAGDCYTDNNAGAMRKLCWDGAEWDEIGGGVSASTVWTRSFSIYNYSASYDNVVGMMFHTAATVTRLDCHTGGADTVVVTAYECNASAASCSTTGLSVTAASTNASDTSASNGSIDATDRVVFALTSLSGTPTYLQCDLGYTVP